MIDRERALPGMKELWVHDSTHCCWRQGWHGNSAVLDGDLRWYSALCPGHPPGKGEGVGFTVVTPYPIPPDEGMGFAGVGGRLPVVGDLW